MQCLADNYTGKARSVKCVHLCKDGYVRAVHAHACWLAVGLRHRAVLRVVLAEGVFFLQ